MENIVVLHLNNGSDLTELIIREDMTLAAYSFDNRQWIELGKLDSGDLVTIATKLYAIGTQPVYDKIRKQHGE